MSLEIAGRRLGIDQPLFVIAELGLNHGGSTARALELVDAAADSGASAVKLQTFRADELVAPTCAPPAHVGATSLREFFRPFELDEDAHRLVAERARARGLAFIATPFSRDAVEMLERVGVDAYKIASGDITYHALIERCAATGKPVVISTGMSTLDEVASAVVTARIAGAGDVATLHCVSAYPVPHGSENLRAIATLRSKIGGVVGLSDHGADAGAVAIAVALGASIYERHLMLPGDEGVDSAVSSSPTEFAEIVRIAAATSASLGHGRKECLPAEAANLGPSRRSLHAVKALRPGDVVREEDIAILRPAAGLSPEHERAIVGMRMTHRIDAGAAFQPSDVPAWNVRDEVA